MTTFPFDCYTSLHILLLLPSFLLLKKKHGPQTVTIMFVKVLNWLGQLGSFDDSSQVLKIKSLGKICKNITLECDRHPRLPYL